MVSIKSQSFAWCLHSFFCRFCLSVENLCFLFTKSILPLVKGYGILLMSIDLKLDNQKSLVENTQLQKEILKHPRGDCTEITILKSSVEAAEEGTKRTLRQPCSPSAGVHPREMKSQPLEVVCTPRSMQCYSSSPR